MTDLVPGDKVLTANGYQTLYSMVHQKDDTKSAEFFQIYTDKSPKQPLEITGDHMIVVTDKIHPVPASAIRPGDVLESTNWPNEGMKVTDVKKVHRSGLYAPMTADGTVVVDGVVASCYVAIKGNQGEYLELDGGVSTGLSQHLLSHLFLSPVRMVCIGISMNICQAYDDDGLAYFAKLGFGMADFLYAQPLPIQISLLAVFLLVCGALFAVESVFGPQLALFVVAGLAATPLLLRKWRQLSSKTQKAKED